MPNQPKEIARFPPVGRVVRDIENGLLEPQLKELPMFGKKNRKIAELSHLVDNQRELISHLQDEVALAKANSLKADVARSKQNAKLREELASLRGPDIGIDGGQSALDNYFGLGGGQSALDNYFGLGGGQSALDSYFGLGRANWLTRPRVLMNGMNDRWKYEISALLNQLDAEYENMDWENIEIHVQGRRGGKVTKIPSWWGEYRHANKAKVDAARTLTPPQE